MKPEDFERICRSEFEKITYQDSLRIYNPNDLLNITIGAKTSNIHEVLYLALSFCDESYISKEKGRTTGIAFNTREGEGEITYLGVNLKIQRKGVGRKLVGAVEEICRTINIKQIKTVNNCHAPFYRSIGWVSIAFGMGKIL